MYPQKRGMYPQDYGTYRMNYKKAENSGKMKARKRGVYGPFGGAGGIRTHVPLRTNGFQDRLVMTTSIQLHVNNTHSILLYKRLFFNSKIQIVPRRTKTTINRWRSLCTYIIVCQPISPISLSRSSLSL